MHSFSSHDKPLLLVFPFPFLSHYLRCIVLARSLSAEYRVMFLSHPAFDSFLRKEHIPTFTCSTWETSSLVRRLRNFDFSWLDEETVERHALDRLAAIKRYAPAAVLGDNDPAVKIAADISGTTYISLMNGYMSRYYAGIRGLSARHPLYFLLRRMPETWRNRLTVLGERRAMKKLERTFNRIRSRHGLLPLESYRDELEGDVNFICDPEDLFPQSQLPGNYLVIGPLIYDPPGDEARIDTLLDPAKKTIYVNMGSSGDWSSVRFLNDASYRKYNIITAGDAGGVLTAVRTANFSFIPARAILPYSDLAICHGGNGILQQCLRYKVPVLSKTSWFEQEWNVQAIQRKGLGSSLDAVRDKAALLKLVQAWMGGELSAGKQACVPDHRDRVN